MLWSEVLVECDDVERQARLRLATAMVPMVGVVYVLAYALSFAFIESVMATGVILSVFGIVATRAAFRCGSGAGVVVGAFAVVLSLSLFVAVNAYSWSPREAETPFAIIGGVAFVALSAAIAVARRQLQSLASPAPMVPVSTSTLLSVPERSRSADSV